MMTRLLPISLTLALFATSIPLFAKYAIPLMIYGVSIGKEKFAVVTKTKTPVLEVHEVCYDAGRLKRSQAIFGKVWEAIKSGVYYPAPSQMNCYGCGYRKACDSFTG